MRDYVSFYGWRIVGAGVVILAVSLGMFVSTNSLFVIPVSEAFGVSRGQFTFYRTIITFVGAVSMMFYGKAAQRIGVKKILIFGSVMLGLVTVGYSFAGNLWHFYALAFVNGMFLHSSTFVVVGVLVSDWFIDKRGLAIGIAFSGSGLGGAVMIPIVSRVIELTDWRFAYRFIGILGFAILLPVILFIVKEKPEKIGLEPFMEKKGIEADETKAAYTAFDLTFREALKTKRFWLILTTFFLLATFSIATNTHTAPFLTDLSYPAATVSAIVSLFMMTLTIGKIILGLVYDRFGIMAGNLIIIVCCLIFPVAALLSHMPAFPWIYALTMGMASCGATVPHSLLLVRYFGQKEFPMILSFITMVSTLGGAAFVPIMGAIHDYSGSYDLAWFVMIVFSALITVCMIFAELSFKRKSMS